MMSNEQNTAVNGHEAAGRMKERNKKIIDMNMKKKKKGRQKRMKKGRNERRRRRKREKKG